MDIKDVKLRKGMSRDEVNELIGNWLTFEDDVYLGSKYKHNWRCKCGNVFQRVWDHVKHRGSILCEKCTYEPRRNAAVERYKEITSNFKFNKYVDVCFKNDELLDGSIVKTNKVWIRMMHNSCRKEFDVRSDNLKDNDNLCPHCNPYLRIPKLEDSLGYTFPEIIDYIVSDEFGDNINPYKISPYSSIRVIMKCPKCDTVNNKSLSIAQIIKHGYSCPYCSDGISVPEKFISNILNELNIKYIKEVNKKFFDWCGNYRYDFYIPSLNMIIETHGIQHYECGFEHKGGRTLKQEQENDRLKKEIAIANKIQHYIEIDCRESEFNWLKDNVIKSLSDYFNLSNIDWKNIWKNIQASLVIKTCSLWNEKYSVIEICDKLNLGKTTVRRYLHKGTECGLCEYNPMSEYFYKFMSPDGDITIFNNQKEFLQYIGISQETYYKYIKSVGDVIDINYIKSLRPNSQMIARLKKYDGYKVDHN